MGTRVRVCVHVCKCVLMVKSQIRIYHLCIFIFIQLNHGCETVTSPHTHLCLHLSPLNPRVHLSIPFPAPPHPHPPTSVTWHTCSGRTRSEVSRDNTRPFGSVGSQTPLAPTTISILWFCSGGNENHILNETLKLRRSSPHPTDRGMKRQIFSLLFSAQLIFPTNIN